jgi:hypothetical protein
MTKGLKIPLLPGLKRLQSEDPIDDDVTVELEGLQALDCAGIDC